MDEKCEEKFTPAILNYIDDRLAAELAADGVK